MLSSWLIAWQSVTPELSSTLINRVRCKSVECRKHLFTNAHIAIVIKIGEILVVQVK